MHRILLNFFLSDDEDDDFNNEVAIVVGNIGLDMIGKNSESVTVPERHIRQRICNYVKETVSGFSDTLFKEHFRMSRSSMQDLLRAVGNALSSNSTLKNDLKRNILYCIWLLAKQESFLAVGERFGLAKSSGHVIFKEIVKTLARLVPDYIKWPNRNTLNREALWFQRRSRGFPGVVGAIDACHIQIKAPPGNPIDFYNRNKTHSIILQGTCDHKMRFIDVFIGMPGRMHDARVFKQSELGKRLMDDINPLLPPNQHILGDAAYPILQNLITPFRDNGRLTAQQANYNVKLSSMRLIIERAFAQLKGNFKRLKYLDISSPELGNTIIAACCVLHNFLIDRKEFNFSDECFDDTIASNDEAIVNYALSNENRNLGTAKRAKIVEMIRIE